ncbi:MAG: hypothetical protein AAF961_04590, partial [Planctomycetota bacterium]
ITDLLTTMIPYSAGFFFFRSTWAGDAAFYWVRAVGIFALTIAGWRLLIMALLADGENDVVPPNDHRAIRGNHS